MQRKIRGSIVAALVAALAMTSLNLGTAQAASGKQQQAQPAGTIDLSARRRSHRGNAAALGAVIGVFGAIAAIAAADRYRDGYYYGDPYYGGYGYGAPYGYAPAYRYGHHHHHRR